MCQLRLSTDVSLTSLQRTLNYLFYDLLPRGGFAETQAFIRDRSRAVRNDFTIQLEMGEIAMESHERCARYHILSLHVMHGVSGFDRALEIQQLMNCTINFILTILPFFDRVPSPSLTKGVLR